MNTPGLVEFDPSIQKVSPGGGDSSSGTRFTCPQARNTYFAIGCAPYGGRTETGGPINPRPFAFVYACATVIDSSGHNNREFRDRILNVGDVVYVTHYGFHTLTLDRDGYNLKLVPCDDPRK